MTATYTYSGDPASSPLDYVRFLIADTGPDNWLFSDEEINATISQVGPSYAAASQLALNQASKLARKADRKDVGDLKIEWREAKKYWLQLSAQMKQKAVTSGLGVGGVYVGGLSKAEQRADDQNTDLKQPDFRKKQFRNRLIGPGDQDNPRYRS